MHIIILHGYQVNFIDLQVVHIIFTVYRLTYFFCHGCQNMLQFKTPGLVAVDVDDGEIHNNWIVCLDIYTFLPLK